MQIEYSLLSSDRCVIAPHTDFRQYEVSQRPYHFASTPPTCHRLLCFTMLLSSIPSSYSACGPAGQSCWVTINHSERPVLTLSSERAGTSNPNVRLPWNICTPNRLEQQGVTSSCKATFHQGADTGLGWHTQAGWHARYWGTPMRRHGHYMSLLLGEEACSLVNTKGKPVVSKGSVIMLMKMTYWTQPQKWLVKEKDVNENQY